MLLTSVKKGLVWHFPLISSLYAVLAYWLLAVASDLTDSYESGVNLLI